KLPAEPEARAASLAVANRRRANGQGTRHRKALHHRRERALSAPLRARVTRGGGAARPQLEPCKRIIGLVGQRISTQSTLSGGAGPTAVTADRWPEGSLPLIEMVEAAGVEPASEKVHRKKTTCVSDSLVFVRLLRNRQERSGLARLISAFGSGQKPWT